jgi:hypothetical protein
MTFSDVTQPTGDDHSRELMRQLSVSRIVADRPMCLATALDKTFENIDCTSAIFLCQAKSAFMNQLNALSNRVEYRGVAVLFQPIGIDRCSKLQHIRWTQCSLCTCENL